MVKTIEEQQIERREAIGAGLPPIKRKAPPPPPQPPPPEPFPGFQVASADITKQLFETGKRTQESGKKPSVMTVESAIKKKLWVRSN